MEQCKISNMYTLEETIAKDYLAQFTYPWEALAGIGDYIKELGKTLTSTFKIFSSKLPQYAKLYTG